MVAKLVFIKILVEQDVNYLCQNSQFYPEVHTSSRILTRAPTIRNVVGLDVEVRIGGDCVAQQEMTTPVRTCYKIGVWSDFGREIGFREMFRVLLDFGGSCFGI